MLSAFQPLARLSFLTLLAVGLSNSDMPARLIDELDPACELIGDFAYVAEVTFDGMEIARSLGEEIATPPVPAGPTNSDTPPDAVASRDPLARPKTKPTPATQRLLRVLRVTAYCDRGITAAGVPSGVGQCAAPEFVPLGSRVYIPALRRTFTVTDRTHKRFRHNTVDIFIPDEQACLKFGRRYLECVVLIDPPHVRSRQIARFR